VDGVRQGSLKRPDGFDITATPVGDLAVFTE